MFGFSIITSTLHHTHLHLRAGCGNGGNGVGADGAHHVLELVSFDLGHLLCLADLKLILLSDELVLCLTGTSQAFQF